MTFKSLLEWWQMAGVDILTQEQPQNWFLESQTRATEVRREDSNSFNIKKKSAPSSLPKVSHISDDKNLDTALSPIIKNIPKDMSGFFLWMKEIFGEKCVFSDLKETPELMILGDSPEVDDIKNGQLFSGKYGELLQAMLDSLFIKKQNVYFATMAPVVTEVDYINTEKKIGKKLNFTDYTFIATQHVALVRPRYLLLLGEAPNRAFLQMSAMDALRKMHSITVNNDIIHTFGLLHPKLLLETPSLKAAVWKSLRVLKRKIDENTDAVGQI